MADAAKDAYLAPALGDVRLQGPLAEKMERFLHARVRSDFARQEIFGEAREAIRRKEDDANGLVGYWQGEFWGKLMMSAARVAQYGGGDPSLRDFVRAECRRLMEYEDADGCITSYRDREFVRGPDGERLERVKKMYPDFDYKAYFDRIEKSDFLSGRNGRWNIGRCAKFEWLVNPKNAAKILRGQYDNKEEPPTDYGGYDEEF